MRITVLALLLLCGCGKEPTVTVDAILVPYLDSFSADTGVSAERVSATFGQVTLPAVAYCVVMGNEKSVIVDKTFWDRSSENQRQELIYHELGHCAMNLGHIPERQVGGCPYSIMFPYTFGDSDCYVSHKPYYFWELGSHK